MHLPDTETMVKRLASESLDVATFKILVCVTPDQMALDVLLWKAATKSDLRSGRWPPDGLKTSVRFGVIPSFSSLHD